VLGSLDRDRTAASRRIRFTELHPHAAQTGDPSVALNSHRCYQWQQADALLL
jgi:hypothetical protein